MKRKLKTTWEIKGSKNEKIYIKLHQQTGKVTVEPERKNEFRYKNDGSTLNQGDLVFDLGADSFKFQHSDPKRVLRIANMIKEAMEEILNK